MQSLFKSIFLMMLALSPFTVFAGANPVVWQLSGSLPSEVIVGRDYSVTYTFTSHLPFTMVKPLNIIKNATPASDFTYTDACTGTKLARNQSCTVQISLTPSATGKESVQLVIAGYDDNRVPVQTLMTEAHGQGVGDVYGAVTQGLPESLYIGVSGNYTISFTNNTSSTISNVSASVTANGGGTVTDTTQNCGPTLGSKQSCLITGTYTAATGSPSVQGVTATLMYGSGKSTSISTSTSVVADVGVVASFIGSDYLPGIMAPTTPPAPPYPPFPAGQTVGVIFTNTGPGTATISSPSMIISGTNASLTQATGGYFNCSGAVLTVGAQCQMLGVVDTHLISSFPTVVTVTTQVTSSTTPTSVSLATTTNVISQSNIGTSRTIQFLNNCNFPVWYSLNGASEPGSCNSQGVGCPSGTSCYTTKGTCFWSNYPLPGGGANLLTASGGSASVTIPAYTTDPTVQWSGVISASLNCGSGTCQQAACSNPNGSSCAAGTGFDQPATQAEFTLLLNNADSYDVETINGFHIPISITPIYSITPSVPAPAANVAATGYICGIAGNSAAISGVTGGCDWTAAQPPGNQYNWVTTNANEGCTSTSCTTSPNLVCGLDSNFNHGCGQFLGYWSANQACGSVPASNTTIRALFNCDAALSSFSPSGLFPSGDTLYQLMACKVAKGDTANAKFNSCYNSYTASSTNNPEQCCGCMDWWTIPGIAANATSKSCTLAGTASPQTDPIWNSQIQSTVQWMKKVCPTAYVYQFDDKTSSYTCTNTLSGSSNSTSYKITFCPGNTGLPSGLSSAAEGR